MMMLSLACLSSDCQNISNISIIFWYLDNYDKLDIKYVSSNQYFVQTWFFFKEYKHMKNLTIAGHLQNTFYNTPVTRVDPGSHDWILAVKEIWIKKIYIYFLHIPSRWVKIWVPIMSNKRKVKSQCLICKK